jgi:predicted metal-dependent phosphoesterase TrpH
MHVHSAYSDDADFIVSDLLNLAMEENIVVLSVTDRNSARSVEEAICCGKVNNISILTGIELDCTFAGQHYHLLGYGFRRGSHDFSSAEKYFLLQQHEAASQQVVKLRALGFYFDEQRLYAISSAQARQGTEMARLILQNPRNIYHPLLLPYRPEKTCSDIALNQLCQDFFAPGGLCHVAIAHPPLEEMAALISENGGIPVIANVGDHVSENPLSVVEQMVRVGVQGIEVFSSYHSHQISRELYRYAVEKSLLVTCGSDFHGTSKPNMVLGGCQPWLEAECKTREIFERVTLY